MIKGVIFDWAGTVVDFGCMAPTVVFIEVFRERGIHLTIDEARGPMGMAKIDHVRKLTEIERVRSEWQELYGAVPSEEDVLELYSELEPGLERIVGRYADLIPGVPEMVDELRSRGIKIGSGTGYVEGMMAHVLPAAMEQGFTPDSVVCSNEVPQGRPAPWGCFLNAQRMNVWPMSAMVKVGDTLADIQEGLNAGMWTVGCTLSGNELGMTEAELRMLDPDELDKRNSQAKEKLRIAGAHYVIDGVWDLIPVLDDIEERISKGERP